MSITHTNKLRCLLLVLIEFWVFTGSISAQTIYISGNTNSDDRILSINPGNRESYDRVDEAGNSSANRIDEDYNSNAGAPAGPQGYGFTGNPGDPLNNSERGFDQESSLVGKAIHVPADFSTIQSAINAANDGDSIIVSSGIHLENIDFKGKRIDVAGSGSKTVIDGGRKGPVVTFQSGEGQFSVLDGFVIKNGSGSSGGGIAIRNGSSPLIINNVIFSSSANLGSGILCSGTGTSPHIVNNTVASNFSSTGAITCINSSSPLVVNTILWHNGGTSIFVRDASKISVTFSDVEGGWIGTGNISNDPLFTNSGLGDFSLHSNSPCIDAGTGTGAPADDINKVIRPQGKGFDMGAFEHSGIASSSISSKKGGGGGTHISGSCFIATAAYGTPLAREVKILSRFRDEYLLSNSTGRKLVSFYYEVSPPIAKYIEDKPLLRMIVRGMLWPMVWLLNLFV